ncbi:MAG TPA: tetratricopeptide repeat protein [Vicinamibacteria bacterium]|nr:tetratricopeptide repeat protein [Vicinamibacteria bacterium]
MPWPAIGATLGLQDRSPKEAFMRTVRKVVVSSVVLLLAAQTAFAEKLRGFLWEASPQAISVDGDSVRLTSETRIERQNHKDITARDLHIGWEVEVDVRGEGQNMVARQIKVKEPRFKEESIRGVIDGVNPRTFFVDGDEIRLPKGQAPPPGLKEGMRFEGKGIRLDDRSIELREGKVLPAGFEGEEAQFMAAAGQEVDQIKRQIKPLQDPELQAYVDRVGKSLVPKWVDPQQLHFTFTLIADPSLNAFALPDGTVVVHSGLVAALENEAQLATVLGHEIAHATHRHGYRGYKDQQSKQKWFGLGSTIAGLVVGSQTDSPAAGLITGVGSQLALGAAVNGHGRKLEDEADVVGLYYMVDAGYDYMEAPEVWNVFSQYTKDQSKVENWFFSDHSTHAARIKNLTKSINADYRGSVPRDKLRLGEEPHQQAVARLKEQNAMANFQKKEFATAARSLQAAIARNPRDAQAHYTMGRVLWAQGGAQNAEQVLEHFAAAVELEPERAAPWRDIGVVFYELRDMRRSAMAFENYLKLAPDSPDAPKIRAFLEVLKQG